MAMETPTKTATAAAELEQFIRDEDSILQSTRSYQAEMFEESLKRNIIVAVSTEMLSLVRIQTKVQADGYGVGKNTHVCDKSRANSKIDGLDGHGTDSHTAQFCGYERSLNGATGRYVLQHMVCRCAPTLRNIHRYPGSSFPESL